MMKWQTEIMHENQNQETPSKLYAIKKSEQQESHAELLPFTLRVWNITVSVEKKKKKFCHKAICCAVSLKGPRYPNRKYHEVYWQYFSKSTHWQKTLEQQH